MKTAVYSSADAEKSLARNLKRPSVRPNPPNPKFRHSPVACLLVLKSSNENPRHFCFYQPFFLGLDWIASDRKKIENHSLPIILTATLFDQLFSSPQLLSRAMIFAKFESFLSLSNVQLDHDVGLGKKSMN